MKQSSERKSKRTYTLVIFKPDAIARNMLGNIISLFRKKHFEIEYMDCRVVDKQTIYNHYEHLLKEYGEAFRPRIDEYYLGRIVIPMIMSSYEPDIITKVRKITGATDPSKAAPGTIRGDWGIDTAIKADAENRCCYNLIHASDSVESFRRETRIWFPELPEELSKAWGIV